MTKRGVWITTSHEHVVVIHTALPRARGKVRGRACSPSCPQPHMEAARVVSVHQTAGTFTTFMHILLENQELAAMDIVNDSRRNMQATCE